MLKFTGREHELAELNRLYHKGGFQLVVLYGRRRVGKTTLAFHFAEGKPTLSFTAKVQSDTLNLADFSSALLDHFGMPTGTTFASWDAAFTFLAKSAGDSQLVFIFDEFPYAATKNSSLISSLQIAVDRELANTNVFLILTGSNQGFMEEKVLGLTGSPSAERALGAKNPLFGRRTAQIHLEPFGYRDAARMLPGIEPEQLVTYYACFGGTPYYLAMIDEGDSFEENVTRLFFTKEGLLYEEPSMLLRQELREPALYSSILAAISQGATKPQAISDVVGEERTSIMRYLMTLRSMGLVERRVPFGEDPERSRRGIYRLKEPCFSFWYRFVRPILDSVERDAGELEARDLLVSQELPAYVGHWFESICLEWLVAAAKADKLPLSPTRFGKWWGTNPRAKSQDDIDVVAGNPRTKDLLIGECKWRMSFDETKALAKLRDRIGLVSGYERTNLAVFSRRPVCEATRRKEPDTLFVSTNDLYA